MRLDPSNPTNTPRGPLEIEPAVLARGSVICLHGLGSDGRDLAGIVPGLRIAPDVPLRFVFPTAAERPLGIALGAPRTAWFDIGPEDLWRAVTSDPAGLKTADALVRALVEREIARGIPSNRIVLGGFSQGGALAAYVAVRFQKPLAGTFALSTFLARNVAIEAQSVSANRGLPAFVAHGTEDRLIAPALGREARDRMTDLGCDVTFREYAMDHEVCGEELADLGVWLAARFR